MKTRTTLTAIVVCAMIAAAAGCGGNTASTTTTTAAQTTTSEAETTAAETSTTPDWSKLEEISAVESSITENDATTVNASLFSVGVWKAMDGDKLDSYLAFFDESRGCIIDAEEGLGTTFTCEQNGTEVSFDLGNNYILKADFSLGDAQGVFHFESGDKTLSIEYMDGTDPWELVGEYGTVPTVESPVFTKGVYEARLVEGGEEKLDSYFVFLDETHGRIIDIDDGATTEFTCEQNGTFILFLLGGSADVRASMNTSELSGTFNFGDTEKNYGFSLLDADPEEFLASYGA